MIRSNHAIPRSGLPYWLLFLALFVASFAGLKLLDNNTLVRVNISHSDSSLFKVYWTTVNDGSWTESKSASVYVNSRKRTHILRLPIGLGDIDVLRIDPGERQGATTEIRAISLYNLSFGELKFGGRQSFQGFTPTKHVTGLKTGAKLAYVSTGNDPGFMVDFQRRDAPSTRWLLVVQAGLLALLLLSIFRHLRWLIKDLRWVPAGMLLAGCLIVAMAMVSKQNTHPDEHVHIAAAHYYENHYTAPQVCAKDSRYTYSTYGVSRLNNREIAYDVGGRYLQLVDFIPAPEYLKLRFLNIAMFFVLVLLAFNHVRARYLFLPLLLTPQAWYLFSYYNSDALSLFAVCLAAYQLFVPQSMLRRLLKGERPPAYSLWVLGLACLFAMQFWLKLNFEFYPLMLGLLAASWWWLHRRWPEMTHIRPIWLAIAIGSALFFSWEFSRHAINDYTLGERVLDCREQLAATQYKPSTPLDQTPYNFRLRDKGVSLYDIIVERDWAERIFYTGLGAYGYTEYLNQTGHYEIVSLFILLLFAYVLLTIARRGGKMGRLSVWSMLASVLAITLAALLQNWIMDFQPQGRYLLVYFPMLGTLMVIYWHKLSVIWLSLLAAVPFLLGLYSFIGIALVEIPK